MEWWFYLPIVVWCLLVLALGLMVGSFINVLVARLPYEKSVVWPSSRCFSCYRKLRLYDNVPVLGYLRLRGKCRFCGAPFSSRYMWVELGTGLAFLGLFLLEVVFDWFKLPGVKYSLFGPGGGSPPPRALAVFLYHAFLISGLIAAALIDAEHRIIPPQITYTVMLVGVVGGALMPWPWPHPPQSGSDIPAGMPWMLEEYWGKVAVGVQPWPFWGPTFDFAPPGSWKLGLLNSVLGALAGSLVIRAMKWLFETGLGREALGLGDADLMMMAGAFFGWQVAVMSVFVGAGAAIVIYALGWLRRGSSPPAPAGTSVTGPTDARELAFGPGLAVGVVVTWIAWPWLGPQLQFPLFDETMMVVLVAVMAVAILGAALLLRRRFEPEPVAAGK